MTGLLRQDGWVEEEVEAEVEERDLEHTTQNQQKHKTKITVLFRLKA